MQVLCTSLLRLPGLRTASYSQRLHKLPSAVPGREEWFVTSMLVLIASYTVSNIIPFFDELTVIIGSLIGGLISFGLPATFILKADAQVGASATRLLLQVCAAPRPPPVRATLPHSCCDVYIYALHHCPGVARSQVPCGDAFVHRGR